ncbi:flagellar hook capping FlgD N-terminal domain-containing protein [Achromobacter aloeverae]|uniref:Basal-body rod modification protein FlgD n=1 Tax=Achromobacter aloeverae TaxID=1750518 RepID=A0A4Q1HNH3_9BURK|nr:flagellar hook capping FlgD N-terminal domain-containing protein [Achromobacter aloeverae]RXN92564.1 flagellar basal body rod modification protein [Achromobacter aloeverae]
MTTTTSTTSTSSANSVGSSASSTASSAADIQNQFLTLLVTQLNNQDPLNPMDNSQLTSQLAQISTVQGITDLKTLVSTISGQVDVSQSMSAVSMIGKKVLVPGTALKIDTDATGGRVTTPIGIDLQADAADVKMTISDSTGRVVRTMDLGAQKTGILSPTWDGKDDSGNSMADGQYTIAVTATDSNGAAVTADALSSGTVQNVAYTTSGVRLDLGLLGQFSVLDIREVLG